MQAVKKQTQSHEPRIGLTKCQFLGFKSNGMYEELEKLFCSQDFQWMASLKY